MKSDTTVESLLGTVFDRASEGLREDVGPEEYEARKHDFVFHMTDGVADLDELHEIFHNPGRQDAKAATTKIMSILYHVIPHLKAAGRLLLDEIPDAFEPVGPTLPTGSRRPRRQRTKG